MGRAILGVTAVLREMISENCRDGLMRRAEAGLLNANKSNLYEYCYSSEQGLIIDEEESARVREIFNWFTEYGWGIEKIAKTLNLLPGVAYCGQCERRWTVHYINKGPEKKRYKFGNPGILSLPSGSSGTYDPGTNTFYPNGGGKTLLQGKSPPSKKNGLLNCTTPQCVSSHPNTYS